MMRLIFRSIFLVLFLVCGLTSSAQVPTTMDYQIMATDPTTGRVLSNKELDVRVELRLNGEDGEMVWSQESTVTSSQSGICTISLDFKDVDWTLGAYFVKAYVNGSPIGVSQVKSVPFALVAETVRGVVTKSMLYGTWKRKLYDYDDLEGESVTYVFNRDGTFSYFQNSKDMGDYYEKGTWKINNLGYITFKLTEGQEAGRKFVAFAVYDEEDHSLCLGSDDQVLGHAMILYKQE